MSIRLPLLYAILAASTLAADLPHTIRVGAEATIQATPDRAEITIGVTTSAADADSAGKQNAALSGKVTDALRGAIGKNGSYKTIGYSVEPQYQYDGKPKLTGYQAMNTVRVDLDDIALAGKIIDTALQSGATNVSGITFTLRDESEVMNRALAQAALKARTRAEAIAKALGLRVSGIVSVETGEGTLPPRPIALMARASEAKIATPVNPGTLDVHASVTVTFAVE